MTPTLRPYQVRGINAVNDRIRAGIRRILIVSPTGSGKTVVAAAMLWMAAAQQGIPSLFLAHRAELVTQCSERLTAFGVRHGILMAGHKPDPTQRVQVASVPTLLARAQRPPARLIILDEARLHRAEQSEKLLAAYPEAILIGLDATPIRSDGKGMAELFDDLVLLARPRELIEAGFLCDYEGFSYDDPERDLSQVALRGGDYDPRALARIMGRGRVIGDVVRQYTDNALGCRAVAFACTISHSQGLVERFRAEGVAAEHIDGEMRMAERKAILDRVRDGSTLVLCNVGIATYGLDIPSLEVCILARPTLSVALFLQEVGRVLRPSPETGKTVARIHDHAGCMLLHGLPDEDREWTLTETRLRPDPDSKAVEICDVCSAALPRGRTVCPRCVERAPREMSDVETTDTGKLVDVSDLRRLSVTEQRGELNRLVSTARASGQKPGWAAAEFKKKFGRWPDWRWLQEY